MNNIEKDELPKEWKIVKLGDYAQKQKGKKPKILSKSKTEKYNIPYVNIKAFEKKEIDEYTDGEKCTLCNENDFLMVWDGARSGYVGKAISGAVGSTLVKMNFPDIVNKYAFYFLQSKYLEINTRARGSGTPHVDPDLLWNYDFPIPPLLEQKSIVNKISELFSEIDNSINILKDTQKQLEIYKQIILKNSYEVSKDEIELGKICEVIGGLTKNSNRNNLELKYPYLRVANVYSNELKLDEIKFIGINESEIERTLLKKDDLLFVEGNGSLEQIGRVAIWNNEIKDCLHQNHIIKVRPDGSKIISKYILYYFLSEVGRRKIKKQAASTSGLYTLSLSKIKKLTIPYVGIEEQGEIVSNIENKLIIYEKLNNTITLSIDQANFLKQSILNKAFNGKLLKK